MYIVDTTSSSETSDSFQYYVTDGMETAMSSISLDITNGIAMQSSFEYTTFENTSIVVTLPQITAAVPTSRIEDLFLLSKPTKGSLKFYLGYFFLYFFSFDRSILF